MAQYLIPFGYALFVWWFSTGVIIYLDGLPRHTFRWSMLGATAILVLSLYGLAASSADATVGGAYRAFTYGLLAWGWQEISFYMGFVTGPRRAPCREGCAGWPHFIHAIETSLYHELAIIASALLVVALTWGGANQTGTWTFLILWWMHQSAKLNVFLGVRNLNEEFLPEHLSFLKSFLKKKPMNFLFPLSVTISTVIAVLLVQQAFAPGAGEFEATAFTFLGAMMVLAILEHWFLVLPLPAAALWNWGLKSRAAQHSTDVEIVAGFLGVGKTTLLRRRLATAAPNGRTVVLVNDFSAVGVDGSLLEGQGANVVELPNGCICCSLRRDLAGQLKDLISRWAPERVLIEPSGVADIAELYRTLQEADLRPLVRQLEVCTVVGASTFLQDYARMPDYFAATTRLANLLLINKTDLVSAAELDVVRNTLRALNPRVPILAAAYGAEVAEERAEAINAAPLKSEPPEAVADHREREAALEYQSWSTSLAGRCDPQGLHDLLEAVTRGAFGEVERVKGIARAGSGWIHFDVAGGRSRIAAFAGSEGEQPRVVAIGRAVDEVRLQAAFDACAAAAAV